MSNSPIAQSPFIAANMSSVQEYLFEFASKPEFKALRSAKISLRLIAFLASSNVIAEKISCRVWRGDGVAGSRKGRIRKLIPSKPIARAANFGLGIEEPKLTQ